MSQLPCRGGCSARLMSRAAAQGSALFRAHRQQAFPAKIKHSSMSKKRNQSDLPKEDAVKREDGRDFDGEYEGDTDEFDSDDAGGEEGWVSDDGSEEEDDGNGMGAGAAEGLELDEVDEEGHKRTFVPGRDALEEGEELVVDSSAYDMLHELKMEWPCLSFDFLRDSLGDVRALFPMSCYAVAGTQAVDSGKNKLVVLKLSDLHKTKHDDSSDSDDASDDGNLDDDPTLQHKFVPHSGCINRVRSMPQEPTLVATWSDTGKVHVFNVAPQLMAIDSPGAPVIGQREHNRPLFTCNAHRNEGFAMDWSPTVAGRLLTGDCDGNIFIWNKNSAATWVVDSDTYNGHSASVEDVQWSPSENDVFASCSCDGTIRLWDARTKAGAALQVRASTTDVNVLSWNRVVDYLLASGADDGALCIWDLRNFTADSAVASLRWHQDAITSVEWHPREDSVVACSGADNQLTLWDMSLERDEEEEAELRRQGIDVRPRRVCTNHSNL
jgi:ribosome assembly protein RRB1